ncbi:MAG: RNA-binding S4 domain-containing protein [Lachnospiraceae bacterium]|nr:RNA-binding S4 domain-containing protein [Lachnospiraceae bacterium]MBR6452582.1 RNA-binding S4 domain-containing protein [Lachnospiraceae bacterium]
MIKITIRDDHIKLCQLLKLSDIAQSGAEAKEMIMDGEVKVNDETEYRKGRKCFPGDIICCGDQTICVENNQ